MAKLAAKLQTI